MVTVTFSFTADKDYGAGSWFSPGFTFPTPKNNCYPSLSGVIIGTTTKTIVAIENNGTRIAFLETIPKGTVVHISGSYVSAS